MNTPSRNSSIPHYTECMSILRGPTYCGFVLQTLLLLSGLVFCANKICRIYHDICVQQSQVSTITPLRFFEKQYLTNSLVHCSSSEENSCLAVQNKSQPVIQIEDFLIYYLVA